MAFDLDDSAMASFADSISEVNENIYLIDHNAMKTSLEAQGDWLKGIAGNSTVGEFLGKREILISEKKSLPPYLARGIIGDRKPAEEFAEMPEGMRIKFRAIMPGGSVYETSLATMAGKRVSFFYVAAYPGHQAYLDEIGGIYNLEWPYTAAIRMKSVLQINDVTVAEGAVVGLAQYQYLQVGFLRPGIYDPLDPVWETTNKPVRSGNRYNIFITTQKTSLHEVSRLGHELEDEIHNFLLDNPGLENTTASDDLIDKSLYLSGMTYFSGVDTYSEYASKLVNVVAVSHISMGYVCNEIKPVYFWFLFLGINKGGAHIDVVRGVKCPTSTIGNSDNEVDWMKAVGAIGTDMESEMFKILYEPDSGEDEVDAVSTGEVLTMASIQGIPIHVLKNPATLEADLAKISAHSVVKNHIRSFVNGGYVATIPQHEVVIGNWVGQGWIVADETSGAAGYMICGGLHGETVVLSGGSLSKATDDFFITLLKLGKKAWAWGDKKLIAYTGVIAAAIHLAATIAMIVSGHYIFAGVCFALFVVSILAAIVLIRLLDNYAWIRTRRRKYAFA